MSLSHEQSEFLLDVCLLVQYAKKSGFKVTPGELKRTKEQQKIYIESGRSRTMDSLHLDSLAIDLNIFLNGVYVNNMKRKKALRYLKPLGVFWEALSPQNVWGGNFDKDYLRDDPWIDVAHFQRNKS